jgi:hypothetical protein
MDTTTNFDFGLPQRDESPVSIIPTRPMLLLRPGEQLPRHAAPGEAVTVPAWILAMLEPGDWQRGE